MAKVSRAPAWQRALIILTGTFVVGVVIACLYWANVVFIPLALGVFLTFLMSPLVVALQRRGLGRIPSLVLVVSLVALILVGVGWVVTVQMTNLFRELPNHARNVYRKTDTLREMGLASVADTIDPIMHEITGVPESAERDGTPPAPGESKPLSADPEKLSPAPAGHLPTPPVEGPSRVVVQPESTPWLSRLPGALGPVLGPFAAVGLAIVLSIFMLLKREDLRNRFIRLVGRGRMAVTTKAVDDAGARISRFLLMQLIVNATYGIAWGIGLAIIGVHYALLWGFLAAFLRYVPYIGAPIAALLPITLSVLQFTGWVQPLLVVGLLVILELVSNNLMEPWLYGQSIGVSEVAMLVAAAFWAFLWGPIGLVLSGPLTVCLVVLGRYVPALEFFEVLLGDEPALAPDVTYYQRLLARDQDEAALIVRTSLGTSPPEQVYDDLLVPALTYGKRDRERDEVDEADERFILQATREILEDIGERPAAPPAAETAEAPARDSATEPAEPRVRLLACPARDEADELPLEMLRQLLDPARWEVEVVGVATLSGELLSMVAEKELAVLCIGSLPPGGLAHTRYLCKRLRARFPKVKIVVGRWGLKGNVDENRAQLLEAGADQVETTLLEAQSHLNGWLPVLAQAERLVLSDGRAKAQPMAQ